MDEVVEEEVAGVDSVVEGEVAEAMAEAIAEVEEEVFVVGQEAVEDSEVWHWFKNKGLPAYFIFISHCQMALIMRTQSCWSQMK